MSAPFKLCPREEASPGALAAVGAPGLTGAVTARLWGRGASAGVRVDPPLLAGVEV